MRKFVTLATVLFLVGCGSNTPKQLDSTKKLPVFTIATSEYPSWSTLMVAGKAGLVNPKEGGKHSPLEEKHGVDVVILVKDYDPCLTLYGSNSVDAVCITNIDVLNPALSRPSTAICPTSTSVGADKVIAVGLNNIDDLKKVKVMGLEKSVSEYVFVRGIQKQGRKLDDFLFVNMDPSPAATALQTGDSQIKAICVWNPFALQTLRTNKKSKTIFDSSVIPEEVIDMIVVANDSLKKEGGENFATCLCEIYYKINEQLNSTDTKVADATLTALGEDFSNLPLADMRICVKETRFYDTSAKGIEIFTKPEFRKTMETVVRTCKSIGILADKTPTIGYGDASKQLNFETKYMRQAAGQK